jgi:hypothetical protein
MNGYRYSSARGSDAYPLTSSDDDSPVFLSIVPAVALPLLRGHCSTGCRPAHCSLVGGRVSWDERALVYVAKHYLLEFFVQSVDLAHRMFKAFTAGRTGFQCLDCDSPEG